MLTNILLAMSILIQLESGGVDNKVGKGGEIGCLQITEGYVLHVNGLYNLDKYGIEFKLEDRWDRNASIQMVMMTSRHYLDNNSKPEDFALLHKCGPTGMKRRPLSPETKDYVDRFMNLWNSQMKAGSNE